MINEADVTRRFRNLVSTAQLVKKISQHGYNGNYTEQAIYMLLKKYGIEPKTSRGGKSYFNKKNACTCIDRHIFELKELAEKLEAQYNYQEEPQDNNVGYERDDMSVASRECLANDDVFGADENELYRTNESVFSFKKILTEAIDEDYGQYPMPTMDDIEGEKMTTIYRVAFKQQLDSIFEFGYNRAFTGSKGGNMYGAGVYCTYRLDDSIHNVKTKPEYGNCIVKMFLIGGFDGFIIFDEHNARRMYGNNWRIKDQLISRYGLMPNEAITIEKNCNSEGDLYHGRTAPAAYRFSSSYRQIIKEKGIRGIIYKGNRDGHCVLPYDFSAVIPYSVSFDQGKTFKKMFRPETYQRMHDSIDVQFRYGNKYRKVFESVKGFTMVMNAAGKYNFVDNSDDKELSPHWFDEILSKINPNNGTFGFRWGGHDFIGSIVSPPGSTEKGCIMDDGEPYCDFSDLPDLVNAIENGEQ